jgi:hypothetical protein
MVCVHVLWCVRQYQCEFGSDWGLDSGMDNGTRVQNSVWTQVHVMAAVFWKSGWYVFSNVHTPLNQTHRTHPSQTHT